MINIYARVENGVVVESYNYLEGSEVPTGWVSAPDDVVVGSFHDNVRGVWTKPNVSILDVRGQRDKLLNDCDFITRRHVEQLDSGINTTLDTVKYKKWLEYRQSLRDMMRGYTPVVSPIFPTKP